MHLNTDEWLMVSIQKTLPKAEFVDLHILRVSADNQDTNSGTVKTLIVGACFQSESVLPTYQGVCAEQ